MQLRYLYISLFSFPVVIAFIQFFNYVWDSHIAFSYKLVGVFLVFAFLSNLVSKLTMQILHTA